MVAPEAIDEVVGVDQPGLDPADHVVFLIDDDVCTRCALCVDRCPTGVIIMGKVSDPDPGGDFHQRPNTHGYGYGMRLGSERDVADTMDGKGRGPKLAASLKEIPARKRVV